jgi:hypothetical protein
MGTFIVPMKTHSRLDITSDFKRINKCILHDRQPSIFRIVSGSRKDVYFITICENDECGKISSESGQHLVDVWNKWNP